MLPFFTPSAPEKQMFFKRKNGKKESTGSVSAKGQKETE